LELLEITPEAEVLVEDQLYGADASAMLARLRTVTAQMGSVLLIGHNPGIEDLTTMLVGDHPSLSGGFPTAAVALLDLPIQAWKDLEGGIGQLRGFVIPRQLG
jgi:phosphohistidine phosphatase